MFLTSLTGTEAPPTFCRMLLEGTCAVVVLGDDGIIRYATPLASRLLGRADATGSRLADLADGPRRPAAARAAGEAPGPEEWAVPAGDRPAARIEASRTELPGLPAAGSTVLTLRDVTAQRQAEAEMRYLALHDPLTGLPNRVLLADRAARAITAARRCHGTAAVMIADLDDFKAVNDRLGHAAGDELLAAVAARLAGTCRESDTVARYGGDEFAIVAEGLASPAEADALAARLVQVCARPFTLTAGKARARISIGVAATGGRDDPAGLLERADRAMYEAKAAGGQGWRHCQEDRAQTRETLPHGSRGTAGPACSRAGGPGVRERGRQASAVGPETAAALSAAAVRVKGRPSGGPMRMRHPVPDLPARAGGQRR